LVGDWAIAIWQPKIRELILARDYAGIRQLFYHFGPFAVVWSNHLAPLALSGDQFNLCDEYFAGYLALWPDAHLTPYKEILSVPPGAFVQVRDRKIQVHSYWTFSPRPQLQYRDDRDYEEHFRQLFRQAVRRRLRTYSPILADLSGGLDSSSIVCVADDILEEEGAGAPSLDTFSARDSAEQGDEDFLYFRKVEEKRGRAGHHAELLGIGDELSFEYSSFDASPGFIREDLKAARSNVMRSGGYRVALSGIGGDEMLGQALDPRVQLADLLRQLNVKDLGRQLWAWALLLRRPWVQLAWDAFLLQLPASIRCRVAASSRIEPWINQGFARRQQLPIRQLDAAEGPWHWRPSVRDSYQTFRMLSRQMTHAHPSSGETRYPYLDQNLCEFLMSIPTEQLLRPGQRRSLMRRSLGQFLPAEIATRRTKSSGSRYFSVALQKHWADLEAVLASPIIGKLGYINQLPFLSALANAKNGKLSLYFLRLMKALSWELWLRYAISKGVISAPREYEQFSRGVWQNHEERVLVHK
jgi:asparagine synthase (glutamine-hydrolysing)